MTTAVQLAEITTACRHACMRAWQRANQNQAGMHACQQSNANVQAEEELGADFEIAHQLKFRVRATYHPPYVDGLKSLKPIVVSHSSVGQSNRLLRNDDVTKPSGGRRFDPVWESFFRWTCFTLRAIYIYFAISEAVNVDICPRTRPESAACRKYTRWIRRTFVATYVRLLNPISNACHSWFGGGTRLQHTYVQCSERVRAYAPSPQAPSLPILAKSCVFAYVGRHTLPSATGQRRNPRVPRDQRICTRCQHGLFWGRREALDLTIRWIAGLLSARSYSTLLEINMQVCSRGSIRCGLLICDSRIPEIGHGGISALIDYLDCAAHVSVELAGVIYLMQPDEDGGRHRSIYRWGLTFGTFENLVFS